MVKQSHKVYVLAMALSLWALTWSVPCPVYAEPTDPLNPFEPRSTSITPDDDSDKNKSADDLIKEALTLQQDDRPLDARTKLLKALQKDPQAFEAHLLLADYYLRQVGHFRLALAYTKQAFKLFEAKAGKAPYQNAHAKLLHRDLLSLLSSVRLNLDNYEGALEVLDEYEALGYYESWLPAQRAAAKPLPWPPY